MNWFETVKSAVTVKQAAEYYGCKVNRGDMICCPFHDDRHPSMKLNRDYFCCFGCGATGDVIDFVARLFGLSSYEAAKKLAYRCMFFNLRLEMEAYLRYEKAFERIVSGCPAVEWEDDEYDPDEV